MANVNCMRCKHYFTTWDQHAPRGCRVYNLKSTTIPSILVKNESGQDCLSYELKEKPKKDTGLDLNDPDLW